MNELTQSRIRAATTFWGVKVDQCNAVVATTSDSERREAAITLAGAYAEGFLREVRLLLANDEVMKG